MVEFCREFFDAKLRHPVRLLLLQCDSGDRHRNLISCARHNIVNEYRQAELRQGVVHVVFVVQLPRVAGGCFVGFQVHTQCVG